MFDHMSASQLAASGKPPFFRSTPSEVVDSWLDNGFRLAIRGQVALKSSEREMLEAWREASRERDIFDIRHMHVVLDRISGKSRSEEYVYRLLHKLSTSLAEAGIVWRERLDDGNKNGRSMIFTLRGPEEVARAWEGGATVPQGNPALRKKSGIKQAAAKVKSDHIEATHQLLVRNGYFLPEPDNSEPWTVHLISQLIERCSRSSSRVEVDHINSSIILGGELVGIQVNRIHHGWDSEHEYGIITADDSQVILAIMTLAMQSINGDLQKGRQPTNRIKVDLKKLSKTLGRGIDRPLYRSFQTGMARIINTEFLMEMNPDGYIARRLGENLQQPASRIRLRLVENAVEGAGDADVNSDDWHPRTNMRYFYFSLNPLIWQGLVEGQGWVVHPGLLYERSGMAHKIYNHLRSQTTTHNSYTVSGEDLMVILNYHHGNNHSQMRAKFCERLWSLFYDSAAQSDALLAPDLVEAGMAFNFFDLELSVSPSNRHKNGIIIQALQSAQTEQLRQRQQARAHYLMQRVNNPALPGDSA